MLGMDPPGLCFADLSPLPLARQPAAHRALRGQESTAPAASFCSCCHHNVITFPDRLAASPRILYSITLLLESQKYLHPTLSVFPNFCLNLPQEHSGLFWFFFPDNLLISPILASLPAAITIRGQRYRSGSAKNRCQQESRKLQNRRLVFYKGDDSTRKGWGGHMQTGLAVNANHCLSHIHRLSPLVQDRTLQATGPTTTANSDFMSENYHHQHGATKHNFYCYSQTPTALYKQM